MLGKISFNKSICAVKTISWFSKSTTEVLSVKVVLDVIDIATVKGNALLELNTIDLTDYTGTKLEQAQEALEEVRSNISDATTGKEIYELLEEFYELIESL